MLSNRGFLVALSVFNAAALLYALFPIIVVIAGSFGSSSYLRFPPQDLTIRWYAAMLQSADYQAAFFNSLRVGIPVALAASLIGVCTAWALVRHRIRASALLEGLFLLPLTLPHLVLGIALLTLSQSLGIGDTLWRLIAAHVVITIPYTLRMLIPVIHELRTDIEEAAADLGASTFDVFRTVTAPLLLRPVLLSAVVALLVSFDELVIALFLAPPAQRTMPIQLLSNIEFALDPSVAAVSSVLILVTFVVMMLGGRSLRAP